MIESVLIVVQQGATSVAACAERLGIPASDVSRAKAALIKAGKLSANSKKGTMEVKQG